MRTRLSSGWVAVDEIRPIITHDTAFFGEMEAPLVPDIKTEAIRQLWWIGTLYPSMEEIQDGIHEYMMRFARHPDLIVVPDLDGAIIQGIPIATAGH